MDTPFPGWVGGRFRCPFPTVVMHLIPSPRQTFGILTRLIEGDATSRVTTVWQPAWASCSRAIGAPLPQICPLPSVASSRVHLPLHPPFWPYLLVLG
jgi:hypothetical protein